MRAQRGGEAGHPARGEHGLEHGGGADGAAEEEDLALQARAQAPVQVPADVRVEGEARAADDQLVGVHAPGRVARAALPDVVAVRAVDAHVGGEGLELGAVRAGRRRGAHEELGRAAAVRAAVRALPAARKAQRAVVARPRVEGALEGDDELVARREHHPKPVAPLDKGGEHRRAEGGVRRVQRPRDPAAQPLVGRRGRGESPAVGRAGGQPRARPRAGGRGRECQGEREAERLHPSVGTDGR